MIVLTLEGALEQGEIGIGTTLKLNKVYFFFLIDRFDFLIKTVVSLS